MKKIFRYTKDLKLEKVISRYGTVEPQYEKVPRDWQNLFTITRFHYIKVLFHMFYMSPCWSEENFSLYQGLET